MLDNKGYRHSLRICDANCTARMDILQHLKVKLHTNCVFCSLNSEAVLYKQPNHLMAPRLSYHTGWPKGSWQTASAHIVLRHNYRIRRNMNCKHNFTFASHALCNTCTCWRPCAVSSWQVAGCAFCFDGLFNDAAHISASRRSNDEVVYE